MKRLLLFLTLSVGCMTANAAAPKRPMLVQGKTWEYVHYHFADRETPGPDGKLYERTYWMSYYELKGDTVIDGRQYMKMYCWDWKDTQRKYFGAFREDEEGRVYQYDLFSDKQDTKMFDPSMDFGDGDHPDTIVVETIKSNGRLFNRYRYQRFYNGELADWHIAIEGIGYPRNGIVQYLFIVDDCPPNSCDYEVLNSVECNDFWFSASDFYAPKEIELADGEQQLINSNNDFAFNLFREARRDTSCVLSPLSITYALGMLNNGAAGQTQQEINQTLGFGEAGADAINAFCRKMLKETNTLDVKTKALIANTIFVNEGLGYRLQDGFIDKINIYYNAQPQNRDFTDGKTVDVINKWASDHTEGMIPKVLDTLTFDTLAVSYLLNALYFKGMWSNPFKVEDTQYEPFGGGPDVPMMHKEYEHFGYAENDLYQAVKLPYGNGAYLMTVFLPREDKTVGDVLNSLNGSNWQPQFLSTELDLKLPRFETDTHQPLVKIMSDLGMPTAFKQWAEFPYFCNTPCYISTMFQVAKIKLDEQGTEAAAVTVLATGATSMPHIVDFHANRPFLYIISEHSTGVIFFIGQYSGGVTADTRTGIVATKSLPVPAADNQIYNLAGQKVSPSYKGIVIQNGKKIVK